MDIQRLHFINSFRIHFNVIIIKREVIFIQKFLIDAKINQIFLGSSIWLAKTTATRAKHPIILKAMK